MTKPAPLEFGKYYHLYSRGNNRENVFIEERNYYFFMRRYTYFMEPVADTYAYCLLRNHFHFLVRIKTVEEQQTLRDSESRRVLEPSHQFGSLLNSYAKAINKIYGRTGSLFQHPFGRQEITAERYLQNVVIYIHQNPQRHGLCEDFRDWPYSSYNALNSRGQTRLKREDVLSWFGEGEGFDSAHQTALRPGFGDT